jgi:protein-S-isoprenylcysteine O-methyltransferase Ste14
MRSADKGRAYAIAQTVLVCAFGAVFAGDDHPPLFTAPPAVRLFGTVLSLGSLVFMFAALSRLRDVVQIAPEPKAGGHLVTGGVYRLFRHPIYTGMIAIMLGLFLRKPTLLVAIAGVVATALLAVKAAYEERLLLARYPEYADYRRRSFGVLPWPRFNRPA